MYKQKIDRTGWCILALTFIAAIVMFFVTTPVFSEGNIGFTYSRAIDDQNWGFLGDYEHKADIFDFEVEGQLQSGDVYRGKTDLSVTLNTPLPVDLQLYSNNTLKGYTLDTLGRVNDVGAALVVPINSLNVSIGIFGRNGNPFAPRTALSTLTDAGFSEEDFTGLDLENIQLSEGMSIKAGSSLNGSIETEFDISRFEVEVKGLLELVGEGEKVHQVLANIATGGTLLQAFSWQISADLGAQLFGDVIEYETSWITSIGYEF